MLRSSHSTKVLLVVDDPATASVILAKLGRMPCTVSLVENGLMAVGAWLSAIDRQPFDVVVMDINMPIMTGKAAMNEIRRLERDLNEPHTPIIAFSAIDDTEQAHEWLHTGFDAVLPNPAHLDGLTTVIQQLKVQGAQMASAPVPLFAPTSFCE